MSLLVPRGKVSVLIDGQYGSTGKGLLAAYIAQHNMFPIDLAVTNASANAGHTTVTEDGRSLVCYHLPSSMLVNSLTVGYLDAGAIIDRDLLRQELSDLNIDPRRLVVHPFAAIILDEHKEAEKLATSSVTKIGSTQKGVGAAQAAKIRREGNVASNYRGWFEDLGIQVKALDVAKLMQAGSSVLIEVPQGASLALNSGGFYPHCTSREVSVAQALSDAAVHPAFLGNVFMSLRTYPIRVGHITETHQTAEGPKEIRVGSSGGCFPDQKERTWEELDLTPEFTTVTKRMRRVFDFSMTQAKQSFEINRPTHVFLNFCNYMVKNGKAEELVALTNKLFQETGRDVWAYGFGPKVSDVHTDFNVGLQTYMQKLAVESL